MTRFIFLIYIQLSVILYF